MTCVEGLQGVRLERFRHIIQQGLSWSSTRKLARLLVLWLGTFIRIMTFLVAVETGDIAQVFTDPAVTSFVVTSSAGFAGCNDTSSRGPRVLTVPLFWAVLLLLFPARFSCRLGALMFS